MTSRRHSGGGGRAMLGPTATAGTIGDYWMKLACTQLHKSILNTVAQIKSSHVFDVRTPAAAD